MDNVSYEHIWNARTVENNIMFVMIARPLWC